MPKLPVVNAKKLIKLLNKLGYWLVRQKGSHLIFEKIDDTGRKLTPVTVPYHSKNKLPPGLLNGILRQVSDESNIPFDAIVEMLRIV